MSRHSAFRAARRGVLISIIVLAALLVIPSSSRAATGLLQLGSSGPQVTALQQRLTALGYDVAGVDGHFGANTYHAVVAFQKVQGIARDGVVGPQTQAKLAAPYRPAPRFPHSVSSLEVDLTHQVIYLVNSGHIVRIIDSSTGSGARYYAMGSWHVANTPTGHFSIYYRINAWRDSSLGLGWMWRPNYFSGGVAVHGATSVPAYPASHGCVRMTISAMNRLWTTLHVGMPVDVHW